MKRVALEMGIVQHHVARIDLPFFAALPGAVNQILRLGPSTCGIEGAMRIIRKNLRGRPVRFGFLNVYADLAAPFIDQCSVLRNRTSDWRLAIDVC